MFFGSFAVSSISSEIESILDRPDKITSILGVGAPQTATFFCTYILVEVIKTLNTHSFVPAMGKTSAQLSNRKACLFVLFDSYNVHQVHQGSSSNSMTAM